MINIIAAGYYCGTDLIVLLEWNSAKLVEYTETRYEHGLIPDRVTAGNDRFDQNWLCEGHIDVVAHRWTAVFCVSTPLLIVTAGNNPEQRRERAWTQRCDGLKRQENSVSGYFDRFPTSYRKCACESERARNGWLTHLNCQWRCCREQGNQLARWRAAVLLYRDDPFLNDFTQTVLMQWQWW